MSGITTNYLAFDLEIANGFPDGVSNWRPFRPFGISCAATAASDGSVKVWFGKNTDGSPADRMSREDVIQLVEYLQFQTNFGKTILTWNGVGFDFDILAEESGLQKECQSMAKQHIDMMFHFLCVKGYPLGLDTAAKGMGLPGKTKGISGADAPKYWQEGRRQEVLKYVEQDAITTLQLGQLTQQRGTLSWISGTGKKQILPLKKGWIPVTEANQLPVPDTSWMSRPISRNDFVGWLGL